MILRCPLDGTVVRHIGCRPVSRSRGFRLRRSALMPHPTPSPAAAAAPLLPLFVKLAGRDVLVVGGGAMASVRVRQLADAGARVTVVAPAVRGEVALAAAAVHRRGF